MFLDVERYLDDDKEEIDNDKELLSEVSVFTRLMPIIPPKKRRIEKYTLANMAIEDPPFMAIASGISYQPSIVNKRNMEYTLRAGFPKY